MTEEHLDKPCLDREELHTLALQYQGHGLTLTLILGKKEEKKSRQSLDYFILNSNMLYSLF